MDYTGISSNCTFNYDMLIFKGRHILNRGDMELYVKRSIIIGVSTTLLTGLFFLTWYQFSKEARVIINKVVLADISQLKEIFDKIDTDCGILGFDHEKNYIDFLTVKSFVSSEIGAMNLIAPEKWQGPYVQDNPSIQSKKYEIVLTKNGYYIVPGTGVQLSNGKIMGKDIVITPSTDIDKLVAQADGLQYQGKSLIAPLKTHKKLLAADNQEGYE